MPRPALCLLALLAFACGDTAIDGEPIGPVPGTAVHFDLDADLSRDDSFFDLPWPSDLRLGPDGRPDLEGFPGASDNGVIAPVLQVADRRRGWSVNPSAVFRFDGPVSAQSAEHVIAASETESLLLIDVDPDSDERGRLFPLIAETPEPDPFVPEHALSVSVVPGVVLAPNRTYAFVVRRTLGDAGGEPLGVGDAFSRLRTGEVPPGARGEEAAAIYAPLWQTLDAIGVERTDVAAATVFTTGDVVAEVADWIERLGDRLSVDIEDLQVEPDGGASHERFCELRGTARMPQLQRGTPPFDREGDFEIGEDGLPVVRRYETVPVVVALPKTPMPPGGYPLLVYVHGSGGRAKQLIDRGPVLAPGGEPTPGRGPADVYAAHGLATVGQSMPLSPERLPGAAPREYLNFANLGAYPYTFQQGTFELHLLLDALSRLEIAPEVVAECEGVTADGRPVRLATDRVALHGQSMGAQYANMLGAIEPRISAVMPTGSGGLWTLVILVATIEDGIDVGSLIGPLLGTTAPVSHIHPAMQLVQFGLESAETVIYAPRIAHRPLPGHPARHLFQPIGLDDPGFPNEIYDAMALASANRQVGEEIWPSLQTSLALDGLEGIGGYPVHENAISLDGRPHAGIVSQYRGDGIVDAHQIFMQLDGLKHQYGCWFETFFRNGTPTLPAPAALDTPCAE